MIFGFILVPWVAAVAAVPAQSHALGPRSSGASAPERREPTPLIRGHAHNDYRHPRPLHDALDQGFTSVEADVFLVDGKVLVGHDRPELKPERTLAALYLDPLTERIARGTVPEPFTLMIDIKADGETTYAAIRAELQRRPSLRRIQVVISGDRPLGTLTQEAGAWAGIDGRLNDRQSRLDPKTMPWLSTSWFSFFTWTGRGEMPALERLRLRSLVRQVSRRGRELRFWGAPDQENVWRELTEAGVHRINTDKVGLYAQFVRDNRK